MVFNIRIVFKTSSVFKISIACMGKSMCAYSSLLHMYHLDSALLKNWGKIELFKAYFHLVTGGVSFGPCLKRIKSEKYKKDVDFIQNKKMWILLTHFQVLCLFLGHIMSFIYATSLRARGSPQWWLNDWPLLQVSISLYTKQKCSFHLIKHHSGEQWEAKDSLVKRLISLP